ncbi:hypothetical protein STEG23_023179 [Scotinomys teguina]
MTAPPWSGTRTAALRTESRMCRLSWFMDPGGWSKAAAVGLYFIFLGICTLSLHTTHICCQHVEKIRNRLECDASLLKALIRRVYFHSVRHVCCTSRFLENFTVGNIWERLSFEHTLTLAAIKPDNELVNS